MAFIVPGVPQGLSCASPSSPSELTLSWDSPSVLQGDRINYVVYVNALSHRSGTRDVIQSRITNRTTDMQSETIQNLGNILVASNPHQYCEIYFQ
jgi:hypothetical protein